MRLSLRFIIPLALALAALAYAVTPLVDRLTLQWFMRDLDLRASLIANTVEESVRTLLETGDATRARRFFERLTRDERLYAVAICPANRKRIITSTALPPEIQCDSL